MKYFLVVGEASGDMHAANLIESLKKLDANFEAQAWGGDKMKMAGVLLKKHISQLAFMGFLEVLANLSTILRNLKQCKRDILEYRPDALILVDYPGFNLRIAKFAKANNIEVYYYISPTVWAWKKNRMFQIRDNCKQLFVILPFEKKFYALHGIKVYYEGHPLLDEIEKHKSLPKELLIKDWNTARKPIVALLPGSRLQEIRKMLPLLVNLAKEYPNYEWILAGAPGLKQEQYAGFIQNSNIKLIFNNTYNILALAQTAIVGSGTATLETALFKIPQIVIYKTSRLSFFIAKLLVKVKYISLVNLIMEKEIVPELIQNDFTFERLQEKFKILHAETVERNIMLANYEKLKSKLGNGGASKRIADSLFQTLINSKNSKC